MHVRGLEKLSAILTDNNFGLKSIWINPASISRVHPVQVYQNYTLVFIRHHFLRNIYPSRENFLKK